MFLNACLKNQDKIQNSIKKFHFFRIFNFLFESFLKYDKKSIINIFNCVYFDAKY